MNATHGCHCRMCDRRAGRSRDLLWAVWGVIWAVVAVILFSTGCSGDASGLPGQDDAGADLGGEVQPLDHMEGGQGDIQPTADAGPDMGKVGIDGGPEVPQVEVGPEVAADASPEAPACVPTEASGCTTDGKACTPGTSGCYSRCSRCAKCCVWSACPPPACSPLCMECPS